MKPNGKILDDFIFKAKERHIDIKMVSKRGIVVNPDSFVDFFNDNPKPDLGLRN